ncbi:uncharacterized protein LOC127568691 [Pristis pectinata]|uniref:uncharacterized protein LOC127568691 n=1 Tax=Pristis pectinata TaxID=685728 RepID=UPI00223E7DEC|nr:uncharacterized protein LOC127568691 [Pristis pectinata]XP_051868692.1 uncharacterized protein LOC127568691 [Pristis pectinata]
MAVAHLFMNEEAASKIGECLSREIKAVESLASNLSRIGNRALSEADIDMIQMLVQEAHWGAQGAYDLASGYLKKVQSECEKLTEEKGRLQEEVKEKKQQLSNLQAQLPHIRKEKEGHENYLRDARESLRVAEEALERQREHERSMAVGRDVGIGLMFIPIIGTIAGAITVGVCETSRQQAEESCRQANEQVERQQEQVSKCSRDLESCISRIEEKRKEINQTEQSIQDVENELESLHELLKNLFDIDCQLKHGTVAVSELLGKSKVLKLRSEKFLNLDALIIVVNDIIAHILNLPHLQGGKLLRLEAATVEMLTTLSDQLKAIEWSGSDLSEWC